MSLVTKQDLRLGNMFEQGIVFKISGRTGAKVHLHGKGKWYKGFRTDVDVSQLKPIVLSPQVLVEWCGFNKIKLENRIGDCFVLSQYKLSGTENWCGFTIIDPFENGGKNGYVLNSKDVILNIKYLHELQNLYKAIECKELEIKE